jgi:hypothetical protein
MDEPVIVVSGVPRSGTSLVMQMLAAGGVDIATDNIRKADRDNPKGYFEVEKVKKLKDDASWLKDIRGKAIKIVSPLLYHIPPILRYKVIFVKRNMQEILDSQNKMYQRLQKSTPDIKDSVLAEKFNLHLQKIRDWIRKKNNIECLYLHYREIVSDPLAKAQKIQEFLQLPLDIEAMSSVVDASLYRNRRETSN